MGISEYHQTSVDNEVAWLANHREMSTYWVQKNLDWMGTPREEVEAMYDDKIEMVMGYMDGIWECEYQMYGSPMPMEFEMLSQECQDMIMEKYGDMENDMESPMEDMESPME